jgi:hypothetical protein
MLFSSSHLLFAPLSVITTLAATNSKPWIIPAFFIPQFHLFAFQLFLPYFTVCNYLPLQAHFLQFHPTLLLVNCSVSARVSSTNLFLKWHDSSTYQQFSCTFNAIRDAVLLISIIYNTVVCRVSEVPYWWKSKHCDNDRLSIPPKHKSH